MTSASAVLVPTVTATAAGTPALAMPVISCRRVMATSVLFPAVRLGLQFFRIRNVGGDSFHARLRAALEALRGHPCRASDTSGDDAHQRSSPHFQSARGAVN